MSSLRAPKFWYNKNSYISKLLFPLSKFYNLIKKIEFSRAVSKKAKVPVICVGSILNSGAGKTPAVQLVSEILKLNNFNPHILASGKAGYIKNVMRVNPEKHSYLQVGDESILTASICPTWIGKNRVRAAEAAVLAGANVLIMDGGFSDNNLEKDLKILVIDSKQEFGNGYIFPAGPLMESINSGIIKTDVILIIGKKNSNLENQILKIKPNIKIIYTVMKNEKNVNIKDNDKVIAFCGIGYPNKFRKTLEEMNVFIKDFIEFADRHSYTVTEIQKLVKASHNTRAKLVTTRKDYIKIPDILKSKIVVVDIKLSFTESSFEDIILKICKN